MNEANVNTNRNSKPEFVTVDWEDGCIREVAAVEVCDYGENVLGRARTTRGLRRVCKKWRSVPHRVRPVSYAGRVLTPQELASYDYEMV